MTENDQTDDREMELIVEKEILVMKCAVWQGEREKKHRVTRQKQTGWRGEMRSAENQTLARLKLQAENT